MESSGPIRMRVIYALIVGVVISACSDEKWYQLLGSPDPQGPPVFYPMNFPVCPLNWTKVVVPLRIAIYQETFPSPDYLMGLMKRNPGKAPCDLINEASSGVDKYQIINKDHWEGTGGLDKSGQGYFSATNYDFNLMNRETLLEHERKERAAREVSAKIFMRDGGYINRKFVVLDEVLRINELEWRHQVVEKYKMTSLDQGRPSQSDRMTDLHDLYEHRFDESHVFQINGYYSEIILARPELLADRRQLTRRLVEGFRYERLSQQELERILDTQR